MTQRERGAHTWSTIKEIDGVNTSPIRYSGRVGPSAEAEAETEPAEAALVGTAAALRLAVTRNASTSAGSWKHSDLPSPVGLATTTSRDLSTAPTTCVRPGSQPGRGLSIEGG